MPAKHALTDAHRRLHWQVNLGLSFLSLLLQRQGCRTAAFEVQQAASVMVHAIEGEPELGIGREKGHPREIGQRIYGQKRKKCEYLLVLFVFCERKLIIFWLRIVIQAKQLV